MRWRIEWNGEIITVLRIELKNNGYALKEFNLGHSIADLVNKWPKERIPESMAGRDKAFKILQQVRLLLVSSFYVLTCLAFAIVGVEHRPQGLHPCHIAIGLWGLLRRHCPGKGEFHPFHLRKSNGRISGRNQRNAE